MSLAFLYCREAKCEEAPGEGISLDPNAEEEERRRKWWRGRATHPERVAFQARSFACRLPTYSYRPKIRPPFSSFIISGERYIRNVAL